MGTNQEIVKTFIAAADLSGKEGFLVKLNGSKTSRTPQVALAGAGELAYAILKDAGLGSGKIVAGSVFGYVEKLALGGTIATGGLFKADASGNAVAVGTLSTGEYALGRVLTGGVDGDIVDCYFSPDLIATA